ncbi:hypothetical protein [Bradyrhizobium sp. USDA 3650]
MNHIDDGDPERHEEAPREPWPRVLKYWRTISAEAFDDATKSEVISFVQATTTTIPQLQRAISGDADAAIDMVMHCNAPSSIGIRVDFPMTVLLSSAFEDPGAALALSHKLREMPLEAPPYEARNVLAGRQLAVVFAPPPEWPHAQLIERAPNVHAEQ